MDTAARRHLGARAAHRHAQDPARQDPRRHRPRRQGHPRHRRGDRRARSTSRTTARSSSPRATATRMQTRHRAASRASPPEAEVGKIYKGTVRKIVDFGAFVEILPGTDGLLHISQIGPGRVQRVSDVLKEGDEIQVKVLEVDKSGQDPPEPQGGDGRSGEDAPAASGRRMSRWCGAPSSPNGLRVVTEQMPGRSVGHRRHLGRERLALRAAASRAASRTSSSTCSSRAPSAARAAQIAEEIDAVGGVLNAFTGKEYTCYYARSSPSTPTLARTCSPTSSCTRASIRRRSTASAPSSCRRSRRARTRPTTTSTTCSTCSYWPEHPLSFPVCGTSETVQALRSAHDFLDFLAARYRPDRADHRRRRRPRRTTTLERLGGARLRPPRRHARRRSTAPPPAPRRGVFVIEKPLEQVHLCLGVPGHRAGRRRALRRLPAQHRARRRHELAAVPGGPREARPRLLGLLLPVVVPRRRLPRHLRRHARRVGRGGRRRHRRASCGALARDGLRPDELARVKNQLKGNMLLGLETSDSRMSRVAKNEIYFGRDVPARRGRGRHRRAYATTRSSRWRQRLVAPERHGPGAARRPRAATRSTSPSSRA